MKNNIFYKSSIILLVLCAFAFNSCSKDKDDNPIPDDIEETLEGLWTSLAIKVDELSVNEQSITDFFSDLGPLLKALSKVVEASIIEEFTESFDLKWTFNSDGTYSVDSGENSGPEIPNLGTWEVSNDNKLTLFGEETGSKMIMIDIISLTANKFVGSTTEIKIRDLDENGSNDTVKVSLIYTWER